MQFSNRELTIKDLVSYSYDESIWLPEFQRPFVWDKNQVRLLIDSLFNDYTISSILLWKGGDELARRRVGATVNDIKIPEDSDEKIVYLLDGQQRTTALTLALTDKHIYKGNNVRKKELINIYWDTDYDGDDPEMRWVLDDEKISLADNEDKIMLKDLHEKEIFNRFGTRFIKLKHAYDFEDSWVDNWFDVTQENEELRMLRFINEYRKKLNELEKKIMSRRVYDIEQKGTLEQVLEVFERINTKNTKLSIFDIMVAKTYRKLPEGFFDLRTYYKLMNHKGSVKENYFDSLEHIDVNSVKTIIDENFMLQLSMIILNRKFKATEILKINTNQLINESKYLHKNIHKLINFMDKQFNISENELKGYQPIVKFLASSLAYYEEIDNHERDFLTKWFWNTLLKNRYPGAQNERIAKDYKIITETSDFQKCLEILIRDNTRDFSEINQSTKENIKLIDAHYSNKSQQIYKAMYALLKSKRPKDMYSGIEAERSGTSIQFLEEHHIFPKNSIIGKKISEDYSDHRYHEIIDNIGNISLITKLTNSKRISNRLPSEYILEFENDYKSKGKYSEFVEIMNSQFISEDMIQMLKEDNFEEFIILRTKLIYNKIEELC